MPDMFSVATTIDRLESNGFETLLTRIAPAGITYLLTYGLNKSLQDSVAGLAKAVREDEANKGLTDEAMDKAIATALQDAMAKRFAKILTGEVGSGGGRGPQLRGIDKVLFDVAEEWLTAAAAKAGKKLPEKMTERRPLIEAYRDGKRKDAIAKEAAKRFKAAESDDGAADEILKDL